MKLDGKTIRAAIAAVNVETENAALARLADEIAELEKRAQEAEAGVMELSRQIRAAQEPDGSEVAESLIAGDGAANAAQLAPSEAELRSRRAGLQAGLSELNARREAKRRERQAIEEAVRAKVAQALKPTVDEIKAQATAAAGEIVEALGALEAVRSATLAFANETFAARHGAQGVAGPNRLLNGTREAQAPSELLDGLKGLKELGPALASRVNGRTRIL
jgi:chromosome segregation ATPase